MNIRYRFLRISAFIIILISLTGVLFFSNQSLRLIFHDKIWAHRINSQYKLQQTGNRYPGMELDVVFMDHDRLFDVHHPPEKPSGLSLETYFKSTDHPLLKYWLDFKNLNSRNCDESLQRLMVLSNRFKIKRHNIIVEAFTPENLQAFRDEGFLVSWYLPQDLFLLEQSKLETSIVQIEKRLNAYPVDFISTNYTDYQVLKHYFPQQKYLFWFTTYGSLNKVSARLLLYKILLDENTEVLLISF